MTNPCSTKEGCATSSRARSTKVRQPALHAEGTPQWEIDAVAVEVGVVFPEEYQDFLRLSQTD